MPSHRSLLAITESAISFESILIATEVGDQTVSSAGGGATSAITLSENALNATLVTLDVGGPSSVAVAFVDDSVESFAVTAEVTGVVGPMGQTGPAGPTGAAVSVVSTATTAVAGTTYVLIASLTLTLPANPPAGNMLTISNRSGTTTCVVARNGQNIMGLAENLTLDSEAPVTLLFADATRGWVLI